jgi:archaemetzincin
MPRPLAAPCRFLVLAVLGLALTASAQAPAPPEPVVALLPLGKVRPEYLERIAHELRTRMRVRIRVEPPRDLPADAFHAPRRRWRAEKLLDFIDAHPPPGAWKVVAVTEAEISTTKGDIPDWGIAGLGQVDGLACVVSAHIYKKHSKTQAVLLRRLGDLAVHEFGHTLGLDHCEAPGCVMADAKGKALSSADRSSGHFCPRCLGLLAPETRAHVKQP